MSDKQSKRQSGDSDDPLSVETEVITIDFLKSDALVGQVLDGRFLIVKDLTEGGADAGGIGLVYLARDKKMMDREVVVKILQKSALENADLLRKFKHEREALIRLDHPNIVRILDSGALADGNPFMVMEYIAGYSLNKVMKENGRLPFDFIAHVTESVTDALSFAHSQKILHRDIKPANIMLTPQDENFERVRLIDFGIARVENSRLAEETKAFFSVGTLQYIAPEQLEGRLAQTSATDIYAFAIVIYQMLTGNLPFEPHNPVEMFVLQKEGVKIPPSRLRNDLPPEAEKILLSALEFETEKRPPNARAFGRRLAKILRGNLSYKTNKENSLPVTENFTSPNPNNEETPAFAPFDAPGGAESFQTQARKTSKKGRFRILLGLLILTILAIPFGFAVWKSGEKDSAGASNADSGKAANTTGNAANKGANRQIELKYFLNVQKMRDDKPFEEPFKSSGQEIFESGYKFRMNLQSDAAGFIYLFNESKDARGDTIYNLLFPTPKINGGSAEVAAGQGIETNQNTFGGARGTEIVWLIWTAGKQEKLESARQSAFDANGVVRDEKNTRQLTDFLKEYAKEKSEVSKDAANRQTVIKSSGDAVVQRIELEHR